MGHLHRPDGQRRLRLHPSLAVIDGSPPRLWRTDTARLENLEPSTAAMLQAFVRAARVDEALEAIDERLATEHGDANALIDRCLRAGLLVDAGDAPERGGGLFGAPHITVAEALVDRPDVVVLGVPYDAGTTSRPGCRFGPETLRRDAGPCFTYRTEQGRPTGAWDPVAGRQILAGVTVADLGDLTETAPLRNGAVFDRLRQTVAHLAATGSRPLVLGGDHSIALPVIAGQTQAHGRIGVIHVDAHADRGVDDGADWRTACHHGNFLTFALRDQRVASLVQLGVRQREPAAPPHDPRVRTWAGTTAAHAPLDGVLADLPADLPWHVTIDVDALDPWVMTSTGTPVPGGFAHTELAGLLAGLAAQRRVVGVDVCELMPTGDEAAGAVAGELLVQLLAAATRR